MDTLLRKYKYTFLLLIFTNPCFADASEASLNEKQLQKFVWHLSSHQEIKGQLAVIERYTYNRVKVGPLIKNGYNYGLIDIDTTLDNSLINNHEVCANNPSPTIREAVICTINDDFGGNKTPEAIGYSTQKRELLAAQIGNPNGYKVFIITQQHGNEPAGTEAALRILRWLSYSYRQPALNILNKLNIMILLRANPDGGEPNPLRCPFNPEIGAVIQDNCAFIRQNVDPSAGGAFTRDSEADFSGVIGRGYDLNRYHHVTLNKAIRPVENQAMVAAALAFQPDIVLDLHGDVEKKDCAIDFSSIKPNQILGLLPTAKCTKDTDNAEHVRLLSTFADAPINSAQEDLAQSLSANIMAKVEGIFDGSVGRFSQVQFGAGNINEGASASYQNIGAIASGWETINFVHALRADVIAVKDGMPTLNVNLGLPNFELLRKQISINKVALFEALKSLASFVDYPPIDGSDFCHYPLANGQIINLPEMYWGASATVGSQFVPIAKDIGLPLYISGNCP